MSDFADVYLDNILVFSKLIDENLNHVRSVLKWLYNKQLQAKCSRYKFLYSFLHFLGHIVSGKVVSSDPDKVTAISKLAPPTNVRILRLILGCCNYYDCFAPRYAQMSTILTNFLASGVQ